MFDKIKRKSKLFYRTGDGDFKELSECLSIEDNQTDVEDVSQYIRPPNGEKTSFTVDLPPGTAEALHKAFHLDCLGILPYRKDGCSHCDMVNDCIKAKIASNFNRRYG